MKQQSETYTETGSVGCLGRHGVCDGVERGGHWRGFWGVGVGGGMGVI